MKTWWPVVYSCSYFGPAYLLSEIPTGFRSISKEALKLTENNRVRLHGSEDGTGKLVPVDEFEEGYTILEADGVHQMAKGDYESKPLEPLEP